MMLIPTFGQAILINQIMRGEPVQAVNLWISSAATLVVALVVIVASIWLYRRALLDEWVETGVSLEALVSHVVIHEVGHHFGLSDADMHALEADAG